METSYLFFFCFFFFLHDVCIAVQPIEDQSFRLVIPQFDQGPGSSTEKISGNCE